jgi:ABC-type multidrug transport system ATPase subunit
MKQKLALCCALIHRPSVLFLDEPTTGVDAVSRKEFWEMLKHLREQGITILVSTPYMDEAALCDRVALMQEGRFLHTDAPENITKRFYKPLFAVKGPDMYTLLEELKGSELVEDAYPFGEYHHAVLRKDVTEEIFRKGFSEGRNIETQQITASIEDCFMEAMRNEH